MREKVLHGLFVSGCLLMDHEELFSDIVDSEEVGTVSYYNVCLAVELVNLVNFPNDKFHFIDYSLTYLVFQFEFVTQIILEEYKLLYKLI